MQGFGEERRPSGLGMGKVVFGCWLANPVALTLENTQPHIAVVMYTMPWEYLSHPIPWGGWLERDWRVYNADLSH